MSISLLKESKTASGPDKNLFLETVGDNKWHYGRNDWKIYKKKKKSILYLSLKGIFDCGLLSTVYDKHTVFNLT